MKIHKNIVLKNVAKSKIWTFLGKEEIVKPGRSVFTVFIFSIALLLSSCTFENPHLFNASQPHIGRIQDRDSVKIVVYGDSRNAYKHGFIANLIEKQKPDIIIHTGDMVHDGEIESQWEEMFKEPLKNIINKIPLFPVLGNHDKNSKHYYEIFNLPRWYSVNLANVHFVFLDTNVNLFQMPKQARWLEEDLKNSPSAAGWKIAVFHHPIFSCKKGRGLNKNLFERLLPIFYKYNVEIVFNGHDHHYLRTHPICNKNGNSIVQIVTGGGGAPLYGFKRHKFVASAAKEYHICALTLDDSEISGEVIDINGKIIDRFRYKKGEMQKDPNRISLEEVEKTLN